MLVESIVCEARLSGRGRLDIILGRELKDLIKLQILAQYGVVFLDSFGYAIETAKRKLRGHRPLEKSNGVGVGTEKTSWSEVEILLKKEVEDNEHWTQVRRARLRLIIESIGRGLQISGSLESIIFDAITFFAKGSEKFYNAIKRMTACISFWHYNDLGIRLYDDRFNVQKLEFSEQEVKNLNHCIDAIESTYFLEVGGYAEDVVLNERAIEIFRKRESSLRDRHLKRLRVGPRDVPCGQYFMALSEYAVVLMLQKESKRTRRFREGLYADSSRSSSE